ncbi:MAG: protein translocase subunit SecDF [Marinilabiliales bacterium]
MQNKGAITLLAILLALASLYQLSFTFVVNSVSKDAEKYANGNFKKELAYLDSMKSVPVYPILNYTLRECQERELNLGLDLKGGMNVTLEISVIDVLKALSNYSKDSTFLAAINLAKEKQKNSNDDFINLFYQSVKEINPDARLASFFATYENKGMVDATSTDEEVLQFLKNETESAINNSFEVLRNRIDRFGVAQPNIQRLETAGRILIELPGVKDPKRVRKLLQGTASLEFWETYENSEVFPYLVDLNSVLKELNEVVDTVVQEKDTTKTANEEEFNPDDLLGRKNDSLTANATDTNKTSSLDSLMASKEDSSAPSLIDKIDSLEKSGDTTQDNNQLEYDQWAKENPLFAVLYPSQNQEGKLYPGPAVGMTHYRDTATVNKYLKIGYEKALFPKDLKFYWTFKPFTQNQEPTDYYQLIAIKTTNDGRPPLDGRVITNALREFGQNSATAEVSMKMNGEGAQIWQRLTKDAASQEPKRSIAIVLDGYVYSYPTVQSEIRGGSSSITGNFTLNEAEDLANVLKSGKLPAPATIIEEDIVGPSLGEESIRDGLMSFIIAFILVLLYMIVYYSRKAGLVADIALIANVFFIFGVLASLQAVLTLPGIAGIVLTIGMSVDANVLIFERIREEIRAGKGMKLAVADGYKNAFSSIIDANITTLLTGIILYVFGSGPIKGFATTLVIGVLTSLFSAIFITRIIFVTMLDKKKNLTFATKLTENILANPKIKFIQKRKIFYVISAILVVISLASLFTKGLNYGIDFKGGHTYTIRFDQNVNTVEIANLLKAEFGEAPEVKKFGADNQVKIATKFMIDSDSKDAERIIEEKLYSGLKPLLGDNVSFDEFLENYRMQSQKVGPTIAYDIKIAAVWSVVFSLIIIFLYILMRFRNWQFGFGAIVALIHDVSIVLGVFSLFYTIMPFSMEIDQAFIAAILTVVGYSINDTVVVFDRIREFFGLYKKRPADEVFNLSLNSTLSRTLNTSMTTFVVLLTIFIFGGEVIRGFIFALMVGVLVGTYSSVFIASPITYDTIKKGENVTEIKGKRKK